MADLRKEYTDLKGRTHAVEHILVPTDGGRERVVEELISVLVRPDGKLPS